MINCLYKYEADVVACGSLGIDAITMKLVGYRTLADDVFFSTSEDYNNKIFMCIDYVRAMWGKVYRKKVFS